MNHHLTAIVPITKRLDELVLFLRDESETFAQSQEYKRFWQNVPHVTNVVPFDNVLLIYERF